MVGVGLVEFAMDSIWNSMDSVKNHNMFSDKKVTDSKEDCQ